jgi:hypothetical protein
MVQDEAGNHQDKAKSHQDEADVTNDFINIFSIILFLNHSTRSCFLSSSDNDIISGHKAELHIHACFRKLKVDGFLALSQIQRANQSTFV